MVDTDSENEVVDDSRIDPGTLLGMRRGIKRKFTDEGNRIKSHITAGGDVSSLAVRRDNLDALFDECVVIHHRYRKRAEVI